MELFLGNRSLGNKTVGRNDYYARWDAPFKAGKIRAVGYKNGKKATEHQLQTAGKPFSLKVSNVFYGGDVIRIEVKVVDKFATCCRQKWKIDANRRRFSSG